MNQETLQSATSKGSLITKRWLTWKCYHVNLVTKQLLLLVIWRYVQPWIFQAFSSINHVIGYHRAISVTRSLQTFLFLLVIYFIVRTLEVTLVYGYKSQSSFLVCTSKCWVNFYSIFKCKRNKRNISLY